MSGPSGVVGLVLAGGRSRRMGGADKAFADLCGRPMLAHVVARMTGQVSRIVINANGDLARFEGFGLPVVADTVADYAGPLAGVLSGLRWALRNASGASHVVTVSTDTPLLPLDLAQGLARAHRPGRVVVARSDGRVHPVIALWPLTAAEAIEAALARGENKVQVLQERLGCDAVDFAFQRIGGASVDPFLNVNTPDELVRARGLVQCLRAPAIGIVGWKNSGKTTLVARLVSEFSRRGLRVATVKHSHHEVEVGGETRGDTERHAGAGAWRVALVTPTRSGIVPELVARTEPTLEEVLGWLGGADLVLVEGYKRAEIPKIEVRGEASGSEPELAPEDRMIVAIAADRDDAEARAATPVYRRDDIAGLADLALQLARAGLGPSKER